jgi:hypothetical protein
MRLCESQLKSGIDDGCLNIGLGDCVCKVILYVCDYECRLGQDIFNNKRKLSIVIREDNDDGCARRVIEISRYIHNVFGHTGDGSRRIHPFYGMEMLKELEGIVSIYNLDSNDKTIIDIVEFELCGRSGKYSFRNGLW